ncbi:CHAD domain-containing protein [Jiella sp. M17.18]|uniref:CHAD domain-containing protein n=1 Tax=Jiella sp. M17.18 TaxID=3234247 RepID=UPI0034DE2670
MAYEIDPTQPLDEEIRRIAKEQIRKIEKSLGEGGEDPHEAIHDARKRFKKLRGLIRLVKDADADFYDAENAQFRDTARELSVVRDKAALVEAVDALGERFKDEVKVAPFRTVRDRLVAQRDAAAAEEGDLAPTLARVREVLRDARERLDRLTFPKRADPAKIVAAGIARTHRRGRKALRLTEKQPQAEIFHDLRKRAKYASMHFRLIAPLWPEVFRPMAEAAKGIGDDLGLDHDYAVFRAALAADPKTFGSHEELTVVLGLMDRRQSELRQSARDAARRLYAETPDALEGRVRRLYRARRTVAARTAAAPVPAPGDDDHSIG